MPLKKTFVMIGFLLQNKKQSGKLSSYAVTVDLIEKITGIDFFSELPDELEDKLESNVNPKNGILIISFSYKSSPSNSSTNLSASMQRYCQIYR